MITSIVNKTINFIAAVVIILIMAVAIFRQSYSPMLNSLTLMFCAALLMLLGVLLLFKVNKISKTFNRYVWYISFLCILLLQIFVVFKTYNVPFTDTGYIFIQAQNLSHGNLEWDHYFEVYPNNVNIAILWGILFRFFHFLHIRNDLPGAYCLQLILLDSSILFLYRVMKSKINNNLANILFFSMLLYFPLTMFTVWVYNDSISTSLIIFVIGFLILFWYNNKRKRYFYFISAIILLAFTFLIRQNVVVVVIALLMTIMLIKQNWKEKVIQIMMVFAVFLSFNITSNLVHAQKQFNPDKNVAVPTLSWINMGLNNETSGEVHGADPFLFEKRGRTSREKNKLYLQSIKQRLTAYSPSSFAEHYLKKVVYMYSTGLTVQDFFYWFARTNNSPSILSRFGPAMINAFQVFYIVIYFVTGCFILRRFKNIKDENPIITFCILSFLGVFAFQVGFWEVRDRYGLVAVPFLLFIFSVSVSKINYRKLLHNCQNHLIGKKKSFAIIGVGMIVLAYLFDFNLTSMQNTIYRYSLNQPFITYEGGKEVRFLPNQKYQITFDVEEKYNKGSFNNIAYGNKDNFTAPNPDLTDRVTLNLSLVKMKNNKPVRIDADTGKTTDLLSKGRYILTITNTSSKTVYSRALIDIGKADFSFNPLYQSVKDFKQLIPNIQVYNESSSLLFSLKQYKLIFVVIFLGYVLALAMLFSKKLN